MLPGPHFAGLDAAQAARDGIGQQRAGGVKIMTDTSIRGRPLALFAGAIDIEGIP
jgi:hypothetical protein